MKKITNKLVLILTFFACSVVHADSLPVLTGFRIVYNLTEQSDQNNASSSVRIDVSESGVIQSIVPVVGTEYSFVLVEGDFFEVTHVANSESGVSAAEEGSNRINSGFAFDGVFEQPESSGLSDLAQVAISIFGQADSDGDRALSQVNTNLLNVGLSSAFGDEFFIARSATRGTGSENVLNFGALGTFGGPVSYGDTDAKLNVLEAPVGDVAFSNFISAEVARSFERVGTVNHILESISESSTGFVTSSTRFDVLNPIPLPASVWLFGSAILGLLGWSRRKSPEASGG